MKPADWTGLLGPPHGHGTTAERIAALLVGLVESGELQPGALLPSARALSQKLPAGRGPVSEALAELRRRGILEGIGRDTRVSDAVAGVAVPQAAALDERTFSADFFPFTLMAEAFAAAARRFDVRAHPGADTGSDSPELIRQLRHRYLPRQGVQAQDDEIMVAASLREAMVLVLRTIASPGVRIAFDHPSHYAREIAAAGIPLAPQPAAGVRLDDVDACDFLVVCPARQGHALRPMTQAHRAGLLRLARERGIQLVEIDSECDRLAAAPGAGSLKGMDPDARVLQLSVPVVGQLPGFTACCIAGPAATLARIRRTRHAVGSHPSRIAQGVLAEFIASGASERHARQFAALVRARSERIGSLLGSRLPYLSFEPPSPGGYLFFESPAALSTDASRTITALLGVPAHRVAGATSPSRERFWIDVVSVDTAGN